MKTSHLVMAGLWLCTAGACFSADAAAKPAADAAQTHPAHGASAPFLARVGDKVISSAEYEAAANNAARQKFYHGKPPEAEINALMREVAERMINRIVLAAEAVRLGIEPDAAAIEATLAGYEKRYGDSPMWKEGRERLLPELRTRLEEDSRLARLESRVRELEPPAEDEVRAYYDTHPDKFTEPEKTRLSMILLQVAPSAPTASWQAAEEEGARLVDRIARGADFAELARVHSADESAAKGGDLGYLHRGMVPEGLQGAIDRLKPGEVSPPTRVLQGYAVIRLDDRKAPTHHAFKDVRERAAELLVRARSDAAWTEFIARLRNKADIELNTARYPALAATNN